MKSMLLLLCCCGLFNVNMCDDYDDDDFQPGDGEKIVGGEKVQIIDYPYQVSLRSNGVHMCGGAIVAQTYIITAGHCVYSRTPGSLKIYVGSTSRTFGGQLYKVIRIHQHPLFDVENLNYDLAILEVSPLKLNKGVQPVPITSKQDIREGMIGTVSGWGYESESGRAAATVLRSVAVPVLPKSYCKDMYSMYLYGAAMFCAGYKEGGRDACQGDSGGPIVIDHELAGVISWGVGCARADQPGVYTNIPYAPIRDFIRKVTGL